MISRKTISGRSGTPSALPRENLQREKEWNRWLPLWRPEDFPHFREWRRLEMTPRVVGMSMEPTLENGQQIFIDRFLYVLSSPKAGDVVAFLPNGNENSHYYVKRVVAGPGDKVRIADGTLYVNGQESKWVTERILDAGIAENEIILGNKEYFCIGDNPNNSEDSRSANIGPVEEGDMIGKAWFHLKSGTDGIGFIK